MMINQSPKLGYHRIIVACGKCLLYFGLLQESGSEEPRSDSSGLIFFLFTSISFLPSLTNIPSLVEHCRRRKVRCRVDEHDEHGRCENCLRLEKSCNFFRNPRSSSSTTKRRIWPSMIDGMPLQSQVPNPMFVPDSQPLKAAYLEEMRKLTETLNPSINPDISTSQNDSHYFKDRTNSLDGPSAGIPSKLTAQGPPITSSSRVIQQTSFGSMLGSPSSLKSPAQGQERAQMADLGLFASNGSFAFHFLEPQKLLDPTQYAICHCTKCFYVPQPEAWAHDTHRTNSNPLDIAKWSRLVFLEAPGPRTCSEGSLNGSCSFMYSTSWNMLSASSGFIDRQAEDKVAYDCENRFSAASSREI